MPYKDSTGREVEIDEIEGEYQEGATVLGATYCDDGSEVPDDELEYLTDHYSGEIYQDWYESQVGAAEALWEGDR